MINTVFKEATWTSQCSLQRAFHRRVQTSLEQHQSMVEKCFKILTKTKLKFSFGMCLNIYILFSTTGLPSGYISDKVTLDSIYNSFRIF